MTQGGGGLDASVRRRIRERRRELGWSLDDLAARCFLSPSTLSRMETGHRRIGLDQLGLIAGALGTSPGALMAETDEAAVIRPRHDAARGMTVWTLGGQPGPHGTTVAKMRLTRPAPRAPGMLRTHPGRNSFTVLSGTLVLLLGERTLTVGAGQAAQFPTTVPHAFGAHGGPVEVVGILDPGDRPPHLLG